MYNNDITYNKKWNTPENKEYQKKVIKLIHGKTLCMSDCPLSWSKEVYELLTYLDKEFGIAYSLPYPAFFTWNYAWKSIKGIIIPFFVINKWYKENYGFWKRQKMRLYTPFNQLKFISNRYYMTLKMIIMNRINKPKIGLSQVKEKYGTLRIYYGSPDYLYDHIEEKIAEAEIKMSAKGAYFPLQSLYSWHTSSRDYVNTISTKKGWSNYGEKREYYTEVNSFKYRKLMKKMDCVDFDEIKRIANKKGRKNV